MREGPLLRRCVLLLWKGSVSVHVTSSAAAGFVPADPVRALQHALYRAAKADPGRRFHALWDKVFRRDVLWRGWIAVRANEGAPGIDSVTLAEVEEYGVVRLLDELADELRQGRYRPLPARRVFIPKPGVEGESRPLSIPSVRDRIVQAAVKIVLEPVFEADMLPCSFGFRPKRGAHDGLQVLIDESWRGRRWVVETDIANCFSAIPREKLMQAIEERVCDQSVLKLLRVILRAGVMEEGQVRRPVTGTPQGGVITPPTQWATSVSMSRLGIEGWSDRGVSPTNRDMSGSTAMSCLMSVVLVVVSVAGSTRGGSTPLRSCWLRGCRRPRRRGCWPGGSAARCARHAGMPSVRPRAGRRWCRRRRWCSPSSCRQRWWRGCGRGRASRAARSPPWWRRR